MRLTKGLLAIALGLVAVVGAGCQQAEQVNTPTPNDAPAAATATPTSVPSTVAGGDEVLGLDGFEASNGNFAVLVSDEEHAIGDFVHLWVDITKIGVQVLGEEDSWLEFEVPAEYQQVDLTQLTGDDATGLLQENLPPGEYGKIFVYVDDVAGELPSGETVPVRLPSSKLQLNQPFTVGGDEVTTFVFDITVLSVGNEQGGVRYLLQPHVDESGPDKEFRVPERLRQRQRLDVSTADLDGDGRPDIVTVRDQDGNPVRDSKVEIEVRLGRVTTDANGEVTFLVPSNATEIRVEVTHGRSEGETQIIVGAEGDGVTEQRSAGDLTIEVLGEPVAGQRLTLRVLDANGRPIEGAVAGVRVEMTTGQTDDDGTLVFEAPVDGEIAIEARTRGARGDSLKTAALERVAEQRLRLANIAQEERRRLEERKQRLQEQRRALAARAEQAKEEVQERRAAKLRELETKDADDRALTDEERLRLEELRRKAKARLEQAGKEIEEQRQAEIRRLEQEASRRGLTADEREKIADMRRQQAARREQANADAAKQRVEELRLLETRERIVTLTDEQRAKLEELRRQEQERVQRERRELEQKSSASDLSDEERLKLAALREAAEKRALEERTRSGDLSDDERRKLEELRKADERRAIEERRKVELRNLEEKDALRTLTDEERKRLAELRQLAQERRATELQKLEERTTDEGRGERGPGDGRAVRGA